MKNNVLDSNVANIARKYLNPLNALDELSNYQHQSEKKRPREEGEFQRDYARIMYSASFRRLQGKMQLLGIRNDTFFRNRLTHSLEVAQIARSIAYKLRYSREESYLVEGCALAHDLGNPPFGHSGEKKLNSIFQDVGGFEGNAQTLRILTTVENKKPEFRGLNLTYRTLLGVTKYFNKFDHEKFKADEKSQKFIYDSDYDLLKQFIDNNGVRIRTLDVQIVDIADEIAYAAHDLEDGLRLKAFTIEEILHDYRSKYGETESFKKLEEIVDKSKKSAGFGRNDLDSSVFSKIFYQEISSNIIFELLSDIDMIDVSEEKRNKTGTQQDKELGFSNYGELASGLKDIVFQCINHKDDVYGYEQQGNQVLETLCEIYRKKNKYLPPEYRAEYMLRQYKNIDEDEKKLQERLICDYISGMMDSYAISMYEKFTGKKFGGGY